MGWQIKFYVLPLFISAFIAFYAVFILQIYRKVRIIHVLSMLLLAVGFWSFLYALELWAVKLADQIIIAKIEYICICAIPSLWIYFCMLFSSPKGITNRFSIYKFFLPFLFTLIIVFTNDFHHWFWTDSTQVLFGGTNVLSNTYGFWFWIHTFFSYTYTIIGSVMVIMTLIRRKRISASVILIALGVALPLLGSITYVFNILGSFDNTPITITISSVLMAISLVRLNLFNIKPIAKSKLFSSLSTPVFFTNNEHVLIEVNIRAQEIFDIPPMAFLNEKVETIIQNKTGVYHDIREQDPFEICINENNGLVYFRVISIEIKENKKIDGFLVTLQDITAEKQIAQTKNEEVETATFMNEMAELSVNSTDIDQLLEGEIKKIGKYLSAESIFILQEQGDKYRKITRLINTEETPAGLKNEFLFEVMDGIKKERKFFYSETPDEFMETTSASPLVRSFLAFPLFSNQEYFGSLIITLGYKIDLNTKNVFVVEHSLLQIMLSVSRLQILSELEQKVIERTDQSFLLNAELEKQFRYLDRIVETSPNLVFCLNKQEEILFCNTRFIHDYGIAEKRLVIGKPLGSIFKGSNQDLLSNILVIHRNGERSGQYECSLSYAFGGQKHYLINKSTTISVDNVPHESIYIMIDLTKQKKQEIQLRNSEQRLLSLFESMPAMLFEVDYSELKKTLDLLKPEHGKSTMEYLRQHPEILAEYAALVKIIDCNQLALKFYGFTSKEKLIDGYPILLANSASDTLMKQIENFLQGKFEFEIESTQFRSSGELVFVKMRSHIPPENRHDFGRVLVSVVDITKRLLAIEALSNSEQKFRSIIQQSVDGIILFNRDGKIIEWNDADEKITGYSNKEIEKISIGDLFYLLLKDTNLSNLKEMRDQLQSTLLDRNYPLRNQIVERTIVSKNGQKVELATIISGVDIGQDYFGSIIIRDISGVKKTESDIKKLASAVREISEGLVIANSMGETEYVNLAVEKITGYSSDDLIGKNLLFVLPKNLATEIPTEITKKLGQGIIQRGKIISQKKDGSSYTLQYNIAPIINEHGEQNFVSVISDVSQNELIEQQTRQAQKLEAIGSLAAGVAHEINTPTQYVGNNLLFIQDGFLSTFQLLEHNDQLWKEALSGQTIEGLIKELRNNEKSSDIEYLKTEIPKAINESLEGIGRVTKIVQAIKEFSHPNMDEKTLVDLNRAIETTSTVSHNEWKYVADLNQYFDPSLPAVLCSPGEINQVILNLITNAAHAIKDQVDKGVYKKGLIEITTKAKENVVEIRVKDNGGGIPLDLREKVFDPFFTTKPVGMGTGQGLSISHTVIVDKHDGSITFDSEVGTGTTFIITLPLGVRENENSLIQE